MFINTAHQQLFPMNPQFALKCLRHELQEMVTCFPDILQEYELGISVVDKEYFILTLVLPKTRARYQPPSSNSARYIAPGMISLVVTFSNFPLILENVSNNFDH